MFSITVLNIENVPTLTPLRVLFGVKVELVDLSFSSLSGVLARVMVSN
jgi:hypothetical protein